MANEIKLLGEINNDDAEVRGIMLATQRSYDRPGYNNPAMLSMLLLVVIDTDVKLRFRLLDNDLNTIELKVAGYSGPCRPLHTWFPSGMTQEQRVEHDGYKPVWLRTLEFTPEPGTLGPVHKLLIQARPTLGIEIFYPDENDACRLLIHGSVYHRNNHHWKTAASVMANGEGIWD